MPRIISGSIKLKRWINVKYTLYINPNNLTVMVVLIKLVAMLGDLYKTPITVRNPKR